MQKQAAALREYLVNFELSPCAPGGG